MKIIRSIYNPLISPKDVKPSDERFQVDGVFNCGVAKYGDEIILLCRVAESVKEKGEDEVIVPIVKSNGKEDYIDTIRFDKKKDTQYDFSDSRSVFFASDKKGIRKTAALTSLSHLRIARSKDGIHFTIDEKPAIMPNAAEESWGMEDPRITQIGEDYYINYSAVTKDGICVGLISTRDFITYERRGMIFAPENKDVTIFPEKIGGLYYCLNRPVPYGIGMPCMWLAKSPDLIHWGQQKLFMTVSNEEAWDNGRVGGGAVPIKTEKGWIKIYHAADKDDRYCLGMYLLDLDNPEKVIGKLEEPLLQPEEDYEKEGFFGNVVFTCGALLEEDTIVVYYGAADDKICRADIKLADAFAAMGIME